MIKIKWTMSEIPAIEFTLFEKFVLWLVVSINISSFTWYKNPFTLSCVKGVNTDTKKVFIQIYDFKNTSIAKDKK